MSDSSQSTNQPVKLHLSAGTTFLSKSPSIPPLLFHNLLVYYDSSHIIISDINSLNILYRVEFKDVQLIDLVSNYLIICVSNIYIVDLNSLSLSPCIKSNFLIYNLINLSKSLINLFISNPADQYLLQSYGIAKFNNRITFYLDNRTILDCYSSSTPFCLLISNSYVGYINSDEILVYNLNNEILINKHNDGIINGFIHEYQLILVHADGYIILINIDQINTDLYKYNKIANNQHLTDHNHQTDQLDHPTDRSVQLASSISYARYACGTIFLASSDTIIEYNISTAQSRTFHFLSMIHDYSSPHINYDPNYPFSFNILYFDNNMIVTDNYVILIYNYTIKLLILFNNDLINMISYNNKIVISTLTGWIRFIDQTSQTNKIDDQSTEQIDQPVLQLCTGRMVHAHHSAVTSIAHFDNLLVSGSKHGELRVWLDSPSGLLGPVYESLFDSSITAIFIDSLQLIITTYSGSIVIYNCVPSNGDILINNKMYVEYINQQIHTKPINSMTVTPSLIITTSADRTAIISNRTGQEIKRLTGEQFNTSIACADMFAITSSRAIRIFDQQANQLKFMQTSRPVISCMFYAGKLLAASDVLRIYDIYNGKCVKSYDYGLNNCWSIALPYLGAENAIIKLKDTSIEEWNKEKRMKREANQQGIIEEQLRREGRIKEEIEQMIRRKEGMHKIDTNKVYNAICRGYRKYKEKGFTELVNLFIGRDEILAEVIKRNGGVKNAKIVNEIIKRSINLKEIASKGIEEICKREYESIERMYSKVLSYKGVN